MSSYGRNGVHGMRKFLVVLDDSRECLNAMRFAAMRAAKTGGGVEILAVIPPEEFNHWIGVGDIMRAEARERIEVHFEVFAKWMRDRQGLEPELVIREGETMPEIISQIKDDPEIGISVPYTPLTLPTIFSVYISVVSVSFNKNSNSTTAM